MIKKVNKSANIARRWVFETFLFYLKNKFTFQMHLMSLCLQNYLLFNEILLKSIEKYVSM